MAGIQDIFATNNICALCGLKSHFLCSILMIELNIFENVPDILIEQNQNEHTHTVSRAHVQPLLQI